MLTINGLDEMRAQVGEELGTSDWHEVTQADVDRFAEVTGDDQWIHTDPERAHRPVRHMIQHGFLTLGLGTALLDHGLNRVRFPAPLRVGARVRMHVHLTSVTAVGTAAEVRYHLVYEVEDQPKPCCVADLVFRYYA